MINWAFINNPWIVATGSSTISGIFVWFVTIKIFRDKTNKEQHARIDHANNEILYTIRPYLVKSNLPPKQLLNAIISTTSRKYSISENKLIKLTEIIDLLIKEVMESIFLTIKQKELKCDSLLKSKRNLKQRKLKNIYESISIQQQDKYQNIIALGSGIITGLIITGLIIFGRTLNSNKYNTTDIFTAVVSSTGVMATILALLTTIISHYKDIKEKNTLNSLKSNFNEYNKKIFKLH